MNPDEVLERLLANADILRVGGTDFLLAPVSAGLVDALASVGTGDDDLGEDDPAEDDDPTEDDDPPEDGDPGEYSNRIGLQPSPDCLPPEPGSNGRWRYRTE